MSGGVNPVRGDVEFDLDGEVRRLRLTFGALAEIEAILGAHGLADMGARIRGMNAQELVLVLAALLRGGGEDIKVEQVKQAHPNLRAASEAIAAVFRSALA